MPSRPRHASGTGPQVSLKILSRSTRGLSRLRKVATQDLSALYRLSSLSGLIFDFTPSTSIDIDRLESEFPIT
jgi:hypothetical protein